MSSINQFGMYLKPDLAISDGLVQGVEYQPKFGYNMNLASGVEALVWGGPTTSYTFPSDTGESMRLVSDNVGDNQTIVIQALDENWDQITIPVTLNGTTPVVISPNLSRINQAFNVSSTEFVGNVTITNAAGTTVYCLLKPEDQITSQLVLSIPRGFKGKLENSLFGMNSSGGATSNVVFRYKLRLFGGVFWTGGRFGLNKTGTTLHNVLIDSVVPLQPKSDAMILALTDTNGTDVSVRFPFTLYKS